MIFKTALRGLLRHWVRSAITVSAIAFVLMQLIVYSGLGDGVHLDMIDRGVADQAGHVVVQAAGYQEDPKPELQVDRAAETLAAVRAAVPEARVLTRTQLAGLVTSASNAVQVGINAVIPEDEQAVNDFHTKIVEGSALGDDDRGIIMGALLAETLDVGLDDRIVLMVQLGPDVESRMFRVRGIFRTGLAEADGFLARIHLAAAQELLGTPDRVGQIAVHLPNARDTQDATRRVAAALADRDDLDVLPWMRALPALYEYVIIDDAGLYIFLLFMAVIVATVILNTVLMSVLERVREFGVLLAIGISPARLFALVLTETALLGLAGVGAGVALGLLLNHPLETTGLDYGAMMGEAVEVAGVPMSTLIKSRLNMGKVAIFAAVGFFLTLSCAVYPAWKAARLQPVEAIRAD